MRLPETRSGLGDGGRSGRGGPGSEHLAGERGQQLGERLALSPALCTCPQLEKAKAGNQGGSANTRACLFLNAHRYRARGPLS